MRWQIAEDMHCPCMPKDTRNHVDRGLPGTMGNDPRVQLEACKPNALLRILRTGQRLVENVVSLLSDGYLLGLYSLNPRKSSHVGR